MSSSWNSGEPQTAAPICSVRLTVIGLGTELSGDDAVGLLLVEGLRERLADAMVQCVLLPNADALALAHELACTGTPVLLVDAAEMRQAPGSYRLFDRGDVRLRPKNRAVSVHGIGLAEAIDLAEALDALPPLHFFAVQPFDLGVCESLSPQMQTLLPELLDVLVETARGLASAGSTSSRGNRV